MYRAPGFISLYNLMVSVVLHWASGWSSLSSSPHCQYLPKGQGPGKYQVKPSLRAVLEWKLMAFPPQTLIYSAFSNSENILLLDMSIKWIKLHWNLSYLGTSVQVCLHFYFSLHFVFLNSSNALIFLHLSLALYYTKEWSICLWSIVSMKYSVLLKY